MSIKKENESGGEVSGDNTPTNSVNDIASYSSMLKKAIKRKNVKEVSEFNYNKIKDSDIDFKKEYNITLPCIFKCNDKYLLVSK